MVFVMFNNQYDFKERLSPFLINKLNQLEKQYGRRANEVRALKLQYCTNPKEKHNIRAEKMRHYNADVLQIINGQQLVHVERLYKRSVVIEPTMICAANCRYCLRRNYKYGTLNELQLKNIAIYCGNEQNSSLLKEILITGGDPLIIPNKIQYFLENIEKYAPNIKIIRIGTRLPSQAPERIGTDVLNIFNNFSKFHFEIGTQINHPIELFPEVQASFKQIQKFHVKIYCQNVLLKGVNDKLDTLIDLYDNIRNMNFEAHYLFHCVPLLGINHLRTTIDDSLRLINGLNNSGYISGRVKPILTAMTDIGKISFFEGTIIERNKKNNTILLQSNYSYNERKKWNPSYQLPSTARIDDSGKLQILYLDAVK